MIEELIRNIANYDPSKMSNAQLADDMRICFAWYSSMKEGKKFDFSLQDVINLAKKIYHEIEHRKAEGKLKHEWQPEQMKPSSKELFRIITSTSDLQSLDMSNDSNQVNNSIPTSSENSNTTENLKPSPSPDENSDDAELFLPIYPGGVSDLSELVELDEFTSKWASFVMRKPFISLVGSLANWGITYGDIDILVKARDPTPLLEALDHAIARLFELHEVALADLLIQVHKFIHTDSLFLLAKWRIERAFPEWKDRISVLDDSFSGPFTNFVELSDLVSVARPSEEMKREEMSASTLKLMQWFPMLKPMHGRQKGEIYSIDSVLDTIKARKEDWFATGIYVEKKFDGVHTQCHKKGSDVKLITEDGTDITKNCPTLVSELAKISGDFILCGELELWKDGKHQPRADTSGVLNAREVQPDEKFLRYNLFDCLYLRDDENGR